MQNWNHAGCAGSSGGMGKTACHGACLQRDTDSDGGDVRNLSDARIRGARCVFTSSSISGTLYECARFWHHRQWILSG